jgi:hypothetical protein
VTTLDGRILDVNLINQNTYRIEYTVSNAGIGKINEGAVLVPRADEFVAIP